MRHNRSELKPPAAGWRCWIALGPGTPMSARGGPCRCRRRSTAPAPALRGRNYPRPTGVPRPSRRAGHLAAAAHRRQRRRPVECGRRRPWHRRGSPYHRRPRARRRSSRPGNPSRPPRCLQRGSTQPLNPTFHRSINITIGKTQGSCARSLPQAFTEQIEVRRVNPMLVRKKAKARGIVLYGIVLGLVVGLPGCNNTQSGPWPPILSKAEQEALCRLPGHCAQSGGSGGGGVE
jgi:hypothetical protein